MRHTIIYKRTITDEEINNIMSSAMSGMTYWADSALPANKLAKYTSEVISKGGTLEIHDAEEDKVYILTLEKFLKGLSLDIKFDFEDYDMFAAERIVQLALFGKLIYG